MPRPVFFKIGVMFLRSRLVTAFLIFSASPIAAQSTDTTDSILSAWQRWMVIHDIGESAISVGYDGKILASEGKGRDPRAAYPILSLSKTITAVCLGRVLGEQGLSFDTALSGFQVAFAKVGVSIPERLAETPLAEVVSMSSGMVPDALQGRELFNQNRNFGDSRNIEFARLALEERVLTGEPGTFYYNNGSYALLGALLEALTGTDNVTACKSRVFPSGFGQTVAFDDEWIALGAAGGWRMSTVDHLAFVMDAFAPDGEIAQNIRDWPNFQHQRGWNYGLGTYFRPRGERHVFWHFGAVCGVDGGDKGAYFAYYENGYAVSVTFDACAAADLGDALDQVLWTAAHASD